MLMFLFCNTQAQFVDIKTRCEKQPDPHKCVEAHRVLWQTQHISSVWVTEELAYLKCKQHGKGHTTPNIFVNLVLIQKPEDVKKRPVENRVNWSACCNSGLVNIWEILEPLRQLRFPMSWKAIQRWNLCPCKLRSHETHFVSIERKGVQDFWIGSQMSQSERKNISLNLEATDFTAWGQRLSTNCSHFLALDDLIVLTCYLQISVDTCWWMRINWLHKMPRLRREFQTRVNSGSVGSVKLPSFGELH